MLIKGYILYYSFFGLLKFTCEPQVCVRYLLPNLSIQGQWYRIINKKRKGFHEKSIIFKGKTKQMDLQKLKDLVSKGEMTVRHVRCIILGCGGAGKTTLLRRLQNANFKDLKKIKVTELVDVHVNIFDVLENENTIQSKVFYFYIDKSNYYRRYLSAAAILMVSIYKLVHY